MIDADLGVLHDIVDKLEGVEATDLDDEELHAAVVGLQRERARLGLVAARLISCWDRRRIWAVDGSRSAAARLSRDTSCSHTTAAIELRRARQVRSLPATAAAIGRGVLSLDHVDLLGRVNQPHRAARFCEQEGLLADQCAQLRFRQATHLLQYWCQRVDAETEAELVHDTADSRAAAALRDADTHLHASPTFEGTVAVNGVLDPIGGGVFVKELRRLERELFLADQRAGTVRTTAERQATALVNMAQRSASTPPGAQAPKPLFTVLLGDQTFTRLCELANGTVLTPSQLVGWLDSALLETILFNGPTTVVSVSTKRSFVGAVRRAVEVRDRHCQHPSGCDVHVEQCDVDHIVPHARGGETSQFNGRLECPTHNRRSEFHDPGAVPLRSRPVTRLDELRGRLRWRCLHDNDDDAADEQAEHQHRIGA